MLISVIVPVYNPPAECLDGCIQSVLRNGYADFELLCIDDGSSLQTQDQLQAWAQADARIVVRTVPHGGVSRARNAGLALAKGEGVTFLDDDDRLCPGFLEAAASAIQSGASLAVGRTRKVDTLAGPLHAFQPSPPISLHTLEWQQYLLTLLDNRMCSGDSYVNRGPGGKVYSMQVAGGLFFDETLCYGEDVVWNLYASERCKAILFLDDVAYEYLMRPGSATMRYRPDFAAEMQATLAAYQAFVASSSSSSALQDGYDIAAFEYFRLLLRRNALHPDCPTATQHAALRKALDWGRQERLFTRSGLQKLPWKHRLFAFVCQRRWTRIVQWLFLHSGNT